MSAIDQQQLLGQLRWRYATKRFDPARKISAADWATLEAALVLSPSSYGLQPWKFLVVSDPAVRTRLKAASLGQGQITDASHLVVFTIKTNFGEKDVDAFIARVTEVRQNPADALAAYRGMMVGHVVQGMDETTRRGWESLQAYIALGFLLATAAMMEVDACPMEGIMPAEYDKILGLPAKNLTAIVACTLGYRAATDKYAALAKVRYPAEDVIVHV
jgi:nitroreductase